MAAALGADRRRAARRGRRRSPARRCRRSSSRPVRGRGMHGRHVRLAVRRSRCAIADLHVGARASRVRARGRTTVSAHLSGVRRRAGRVRILAREPAPLHREAIQPDAAVQLDARTAARGRAATSGRSTRGRRTRTARCRRGASASVEVRRSRGRTAGTRCTTCHAPERRVARARISLMWPMNSPVLPVVGRELAHRQERVHHEQRDDTTATIDRDDAGIRRVPKKK